MGLNRFAGILLFAFLLGVAAKAEESSADADSAANSATAEEEIPVFQFSEQELPKEAVMPKLDSPKAVLNRKLSYTQRWQADVGAGWLLDEAFYNNLFMMAQGSYNWDEPNGVGFRYLAFGTGLSDYGKQFESSVTTNPPDFGKSKGPSSGWTAFYERRMMYGKLSTSKWNVIPAILAWDAHAGLIKYGARQLPIVGVSASNRFFFNDNFALNLNIRADVRQYVDPLSADLRFSNPSEDQFKTNTKFSMTLDFGIGYLF